MNAFRLIGFLFALLASWQIPAHAADVTATWTNAASGNWNVNGNWTNAPALGGFPNNGNGGVATYDAVISATGAAYTVTNGTSITVEDLTISSANATLNHTAGIFTATNGIALSAGAYQLNGGTISNTTINQSGTGSLNFTSAAGSLLTGVTVNGEIHVNNNGGRVKIAGGTTFTTGRVTGFNAGIGFAPGQTLSGTVLFDGGGSLVEMDGTSGTLTIGAAGVMRMTSPGGSFANIGGQILFPGGAMTLVNNGLMSNQGSGSTMTVVPASFTNVGTVEAISGGITTVNTASWSNAGTVRALTGGTVNLNGVWSNPSGTLTADATSTLGLGGTFSTPNLGALSLVAGSQVRVKGAWNNSGQSFSIAAGAGMWTLDGGTITGGTLNIAGGQSLNITSSNTNLLTGVTVNGDIHVNNNAGRVKIAGGTTFTSGRVTGFNAGLGFAPGQTLTGTVLFEGGGSVVEMDGTSGALTIGAAGVIRMTSPGGNFANIGGQFLFPGGAMTLVNNGLMSNQGSGSTMTVVPASFTNAGTLEATSGGITTVNTASWSNTSTVRALTGGRVNLNGAWSSIGGTLTADATSTIALGGTFSTPNLGAFNLAAASQVRVTGAWNNSGQSFSIVAGAGTWTLDGGTITGGTLNIAGGQSLNISSSSNNLLTGVTVNGDVNVNNNGGRVKIANGTTFTTARVTGFSAGMGFAPGHTLNGSVLFETFGGFVEMDGTAGTLTIGAAGAIRTGAVAGSVGTIGSTALYPGGAMTLVNNGLISSQTSGSTITISAASFTNAGTVEALTAATINRPGGYTQTGGVSRVTVGTITAQTTGVNDLIQINGGALEGRGNINANVFIADTLNPTHGGGALVINGDLSLGTNAQLRFEIAGTGINTFDRVTEAGTTPLVLDGTLRLTFAGGFQNTITGANTFTIISSNAPITGAFDNVASGSRLNTEDGHGSFIVTISGNFVVLSGYLPAPEIAVSGNSVNIADGDNTPDLADHSDFASVAISGATRVRTFTITNSGLGALTLGNVTVSGTHMAEFTVTAQPGSPVAPGGSTTFQVTFDPSDLGLRSAALSVVTDDPDENPFNFSIQGTGALSNNADLSALTTSTGALVPAFDPALTGYTIPLNYYVTSITVTPTKADANASIHVRINGGAYVSVASGTPSGVLALNVGANTVEVRVTAEDGSTKTYSIAVSRSAPTAGDSDLVDFNVDGGVVFATAVQPDGKTIIAGLFTSVLGQPRNRIARLNADGTLDAGFDPNANSSVLGVVVQPDGKVLLGGAFSTMGGIARNNIARVNADGTLDAGFDPNANAVVQSLALQPDGKVLLGGAFFTVGGIARNKIARVNADGTLDTGFSPTASHLVKSLALQPDGKVLLGGEFVAIAPTGTPIATTRNRIARLNTDGTLDAGFNPNANATVFCVAAQPDGKVLLGGTFTTMGGITRNNIARVNADGTLDAGFDPNVTSSYVASLAIQTDGKVLLGGGFTTLQPNGAGAATTRNYIARVNADGTLDAGFDPNANNAVNGVSAQADGKVLLGGYFTTLQPNGTSAPISQSSFARLINDPATQSLTIPGISRVEWLRGGASPETNEVSFELSLDGGTNYTLLGAATRSIGGWELTGLALPGTGHIRARARTSGGYLNGSGGLVETVTSYSGLPVPDIAVSGNSMDITNGDNSPNTIDHTNFGSVTVIGGTLTRTFTVSNSGAAFLTPGSAFISGTHAADFTVIAQPNALVAPGNTTTLQITFNAINTGIRNATVTVPSNDFDETPFTFSIRGTGIGPTPGDVDVLNAGIVGSVGNVVYSTTVQPDGKTIIAGVFSSVFGVPRNNIARLNADGTLDMGFDPKANDTVESVVVQPDGKVLLCGLFSTLQPNGAGAATTRNRIARVNADGTLDAVFDPSTNGIVNSMALQPDGKVLLCGNFTFLAPNGAPFTARNRIARVNADGTLDTGFNPNANGNVSSMAVQTDGKVLLGGFFTALQPNGAGAATTRNQVARVNADGTLDPGFDPDANNGVLSVAVQADGKVLLGGFFTTVGGITRNRIARVNADGTLDSVFNPNANSFVWSLVPQTDGKTLLGGTFTTLQPNGASTPIVRSRIARLNADGTLDASFDPRANNTVNSIALQADGKVLLGGFFTTLQPNGAPAPIARNLFARLLNDPAPQSLTIPSTNRVEWLRGGASPETHDVTFELTINRGLSYTPLGAGTRISGGWERTGLSLPASGWIRARARTTGGSRDGSSGLVERITAYGPDTTAIEFWRQFYFGSPANTGFGADTFDFDLDGLPNLVEFAFGLDPTNAGSVQLPQIQASGGNFILSFTTPVGVSGITYYAEWSATLEPGSWTPILDTGVPPQHLFSVPMPVDGKIFMRFIITNP